MLSCAADGIQSLLDKMMHHFTELGFSKPPVNHFTEQSFYRTSFFSVNHQSFYRTIILPSSKVRRTQQIISPSLQKILHPETFQRQFPLVACFTPVLVTSNGCSLWTTTPALVVSGQPLPLNDHTRCPPQGVRIESRTLSAVSGSSNRTATRTATAR